MESLEAMLATALVLVIFIVIVGLFYFFQPILWLRATLSGVRFTMMELAMMRWRNVPVREVVDGVIMLAKAGKPVDRMALEAHALAGGSVPNVVEGIIAAHKAGMTLSFEKAAAADLRGIDLKQLVRKAAGREQSDQDIFE
jgi:uncharacterized protein YqfA (UPF0365 family)